MSCREKQKRDAGEFYNPSSKALRLERIAAKRACQGYNALAADDFSGRSRALYELFGHCGQIWIEPNFFCDYGYNIHCGEGFYANHNVTILDAAPVRFGAQVLLGPGVQISTVSHPLDPELRRQGLEIAAPVTLGDNVWVGMGAQILAGVRIGDNAVVAAGSVVTENVPAGVMVAGVPAVVKKTL